MADTEITPTTATVESVARAICRAMNVNPDGYRHAHLFHAMQDVRHGAALVTLANWEAARHVAEAAIKEVAE